MSSVRKCFFVSHMALNALMLSPVLGFLMFLPIMDYVKDIWQLAGLFLLSLALCGGFRVHQFKRLKRASNARMSDPKYVEKLRRLGFLTK